MVSKPVIMKIATEAMKDADGISYSTLCGNVGMGFIPSVKASDYE